MSKTLKSAQVFRCAFLWSSARLILPAVVALILAGGGSMEPFVQALTAVDPPIVGENKLPGDGDWDIAGAGAGDPLIQGFATDISVDKGQLVNFKINSNSISYDIDIYRLGYYGGLGARKVASVSSSVTLPQTQPACTPEAVDPATGLTIPGGLKPTGLVDCGNWAVSASWDTTGATSGIYLAKLKGGNGGSSHIVFVVRDDARQADVVVQTSDTTWQAYNQYPGLSAGGASLYCGGPQSNAGTAYSCVGRATKVSYNRPIDTRAHDPQSFLFNSEYPMVRFLEGNGYDVKYVAGVDTERLGAALKGSLKPKAFFSVGHDEYWSAGQRASVEAARNAGVSLAFFSGNEMYWKTRFEPAVDGTPYRTLVSYKDTLGASTRVPGPNGIKLDPMPGVSTGTWRDTRFSPPVADGGRPENSLTGTIWTVNSGTSAISVPVSMAKLRFWKNTRVENLTTGVATLAPETLGYEWDEDLDNAARPDGLIHLSSTTVSGVEKILDFGETVGVGTATHSLTLYRHSSGALVFGAGTVQWTWGLDSNHDRGANPPDQAMQQATVNLLADMGAQPGSLQTGADLAKPLVAGSTSSDAFAPTSVVTSPAAGGTVGSGNLATISGTASDSGGGIVAGIEVSVDGGTTWRAAQGSAAWSYEWAVGAPGDVTILTRAVDDSGNQETPGAGTIVSVVPVNCPCNTLWSPATKPLNVDSGDATAVELGLKFRSDVDGLVRGVRFYKSAGNSGTHVGNLWAISGGTPLATATFVNESPSGWQEALFASPVAVTAGTTYVVSYHTNNGHYSASGGYFSSQGIDRSPLHAPPAGAVGGNGVYAYGGSAFPTETFNATNYWVDVVFGGETTAPNIGDISATAIDHSIAVVTWTTNEPATSSVDYSTDPTFPASQTLTVSDAAYVMAHSVRLTGLNRSTEYFFRIRSTDRAGNEASMPSLGPAPKPLPGGQPPAPQVFKTPFTTLRDTTTSDFSAGTLAGTYVSETGVSETGDGELVLAPTVAAEFSGPTMPSGWFAHEWNGGTGGTAIVSGGRLTVDGMRVATDLPCVVDNSGVCVGQSALEFVATFTGDPYQHAGFGQTLGVTCGDGGTEPFAIFSTKSGVSLKVRTCAGADGIAEVENDLGTAFLGTPHRFRIDWHPTQVVYYVDGAMLMTHPVTIQRGMRPVAASDLNALSGKVVVDWVRASPYARAGSFLSRVFDASAPVKWEKINWIADATVDTTLTISVRTGDTPGNWSDWVPVAAPGALSLESRYIQYRAEMATADPNQTPTLADISIAASVPVTPPTPPTPVTINIGDAMIAEGNSDSTTVAFPVTLSAATDHVVTVGYSTSDGTATAMSGDYQPAAGQLSFAPGTTGQWIQVAVNGDVYNEDDETFTVTLMSSNGGTIQKALGSALILNDDAVPSLSIANASVVEGNAGTTNLTFTVTLSAISGKSVTVNYATADGSALAPPDYLGRSGALTFAPGTATQTIDVPVVGNSVDSSNKTFVVNLSTPGNATVSVSQATGMIIDDDTSTQTFTTVADFNGGTLDAGAYISETADGEMILKPGIGTEFSGTALPAGWVSSVLLTKGTAQVSNGSVKLQGSQISSTFPLVGVNRSLEFSATFSGAAQQLGGLLLAQFNTKANGSTVGLYARTFKGLVPVETLIPGNWFNAPHVFRVDWTSTNVVYWIDGSKVATHNVVFGASVKMTVVGSDLYKTTSVLTIDWMRLGPYAPAGTFTSRVLDAGTAVNWLALSWVATAPNGTGVVMSYRTGGTPTPDATWTAFAPVGSSGAAMSGTSRYVQFRVQESTTVPAQTPAVKQVTIGYNQ